MQRVPHEIARREQPERRQHRSADEHARHRAHGERQEQRRVKCDASQSKKRAASSRAAMPVSWGKTATAKSTAATASSATFRFFGIPYPILFRSSTSPPKKTTGPKTHRFRLASDALR